ARPGPAQPHRARRRKRARGTVRIVIIVLLVAGVVWGADALARAGAQSAVARAVQQAEHLGQAPTVSVHGAFFLPQAIRGRYSDVDITMRGVQDGRLRINQLTARLEGAQVALGPVITGDVPGIPVDRSQEQVTISYRNLNRYLAAQGDPVTVSAGTSHTLRLTGHLTVLGKSVALSADTRFGSTADGIDVTPVKLDTGAAVLDTLSRVILADRVSFVIPTTQLPFGQHVNSVTAAPAGVQITASGTDVVVTTGPSGGAS
ncbi:MAG: LmeA family phospholipid-binding protein, partial [Streptosporangiaceae bacterium]